ncbi:MAG: DUF1684 domain-containing protein [bacterium]|nr:DUF1684 domain-containing protein [bacterium]MBK9474360.1 DUF1684 domain-containing protein [bacterium]
MMPTERRLTTRAGWPVLPLLLLVAACGGREAATTTPEYVAEVDAWHAQRVERLRSDTGWLTLVGLHELDPTRVNTVGSDSTALVRLVDKAPAHVGELAFVGGRWSFSAAPGTMVTLADSANAPVTALTLATDHDGPATTLACGSLLFFVVQREGAFFVRVKDRESETLRSFQGIDRYPVDARWRVTARLEGGPGTVKVPNVLGQESDEPSPGTLVFELSGKEYRLSPTGAPGEELFLVFGDATNNHGTYGGGRFLSAPAPAADGTVVLDFNRAYNPPCVFTPYATCPLPGKANTLPVAIEAGEKSWGTH